MQYAAWQGAPLYAVPRAGLEPARTCVHWCLRPTRLPIPPSGPFRSEGKDSTILASYQLHPETEEKPASQPAQQALPKRVKNDLR